MANSTEVNYIHGIGKSPINRGKLGSDPYNMSDSDFYLWAARYSLFNDLISEKRQRYKSVVDIHLSWILPKFHDIASRFASNPLAPPQPSGVSRSGWKAIIDLFDNSMVENGAATHTKLNEINSMFESVQDNRDTDLAGQYFLYTWVEDRWLRRFSPQVVQTIKDKRAAQQKTFDEICQKIKVPPAVFHIFLERNIQRATGRTVYKILDELAYKNTPRPTPRPRTGNPIEDQKARGGGMRGTPQIGEPITLAIIGAVTALLVLLAKVLPSADKLSNPPKPQYIASPNDFGNGTNGNNSGASNGTGANNDPYNRNNEEETGSNNMVLGLGIVAAGLILFGDDLF